MAKLQQVLSEEIRRLSRKEVNGSIKNLRSQIAELRTLVKELNAKVKSLEKLHPEVSAVAPMTENEPQTGKKAVRVTPERIRKWRRKLGLSQTQYADLLGVNAVSVNHWETGKAVPRIEQKLKISRIRDLGKRELARQLAEKKIEIRNSRTGKSVPEKSKRKAGK